MVSLWRKEWFMQMPRIASWVLAALWVLLALYFLASYQEYKILAPQLAQLENRRGATQMLLSTVNQLLLWQMIAWSVFFGARSIAQEYEWQTHTLISMTHGGFIRQIRIKLGVLWTYLLLLTVPFWFSAIWFSTATNWDNGLIFGIALSQIFLSAYAVFLTMAVSSTLKQGTTASLVCAVIWLLLWLAPLLIHSPPAISNMVQWLSPFSHIHLLVRGQFNLQTLIFITMHLLFFSSCLVIAQQETI